MAMTDPKTPRDDEQPDADDHGVSTDQPAEGSDAADPEQPGSPRG
ncbi:MAG: hypothetical protein ACTHMG_16010 [Sphingomonas sp.]